MAEVEANLPPPTLGGNVLSVRHYEAGPPPNIVAELAADPENSLATTKEEEWVTKKKVELTTKRQIETRVKRQVVLEDGKVVEDSGPIVTTNTTEDTEKQEHNQNERRTVGDDDRPEGDWHPVAGPNGLVKEVKERVVKSREEKEELVETEDVQHMGDISDEGYMKAVQFGSRDGRLALDTMSRDVVDAGPRIVHQSSRSRKIVDTEDKQEMQERQADGRLVTETRKTVQREELDDADLSDDHRSEGDSVDEETHKESSHHYRKTKDQDLTDYLVNGVKVGQKLRYQVETSEGQRLGDPAEMDRLESLSERIRKMRLRSQHKLAIEGAERKDALTKKPLDFDQEEATRKKETSKWLEHHFGSESTKSSKGSLDEVPESPPPTQNSFINVTMTSRPIRSPLPQQSSDEEKPKKVLPPREIFVSSPELCESPTNNGYFRGVTDWSSRRREEKKITPPESPPFIITSHRINPVPLKQPILRRENVRSPANHNEWNERSESPVRRLYATPSPDAGDDGPSPSPPLRRKHRTATNGYRKVDYDFRSWDRRQPRMEPKPDYTPPSESPSPIHEESNLKKHYQRTRFAADIPPPPPTIPRPAPVKQKSKITESIRKFVGKLRSSSGDRNRKKRGKSSRSPSPKENSSTYSPFGYVDNNIPYAGRGVGGPVAPPRGRAVGAGPRDMAVQKYYLGEDPFAGSIYGREREYDGVVPLKTSRRGNLRVDDYQTSTLGRLSKSTSRLINEESQNGRLNYDRGGVQTLPRKLRSENLSKRPMKGRRQQGRRYYKDQASKLIPSKNQQRNYLCNEEKVEAQRSLGDTKTMSPHHWERPHPSKLNSSSMMNVSFVNRPPVKNTNGLLNGPAKPARTYRSNILRSKSFNVQTGSEYRDKYVSNPQLHSLEESPPPLRSPGIISELNKSSRDITDEGFNFSTAEDKRKAFMKGLQNRAPELYKSLHGDEHSSKLSTPLGSSTPLRDTQKRIVDYSNSFRSTSTNDSNRIRSPLYYKHFQPEKDRITPSPTYQTVHDNNGVTKSVVRRGSDDDYSETVRITSRSDDPLRPSETNTVKKFSKKVIPTKNGLSRETIESEETKTVVKSRFAGGDSDNGKDRYVNGERSRNNSLDYDNGKMPHSVVIEVRSPGFKSSRRGS